MDDLDQFFSGEDFDEARYLATQERLGHTDLHRARLFLFQQEAWVEDQRRPTVVDDAPAAEKYAYFLNK